MAVPTLLELIEEVDTRKAVCTVIIGGATLPKFTSVTYDFAIGQVPTATIVIPGKQYMPAAVAEEASVEIWFGFQNGMTLLESLVFGGAIVDSVGNNGSEVIIDCVMNGPRKLAYSYNRTIAYDFQVVEARDAVIALLIKAGVSNYAVNLPDWVIGTDVPYTAALGNQIQFSSYGDAINKVAEVDGSPWYAMPTGQVRVENRDAVPSASWRRTYFTGVLTGQIETNPVQITNADARPRINDIQRRKFRAEVANFIQVDGAVLNSIGPNGEQSSDQIRESVDGDSGQFPNGAYWIPIPPNFQDFNFSNELIDTNAKAFAVAERYFLLKNRLFEKIPLSIPGDPDVFLGETVRIVDPSYSGVASNYFVEAYHTTIDSGSCSTELQLTGGPESGTTGFASPFADFIWKYQALHFRTPGGSQNTSDQDLGPNADAGSKLCEDLPAETGDEEQGGDLPPGDDRRSVIIGLDGTPSQDFDGYIVSYQWDWDDGLDVHHTQFGPRITLIVNPDNQSQVEMTLLVTDNSGRTDSITKSIYTNADYLDAPNGNDPNQNDTDNGGGDTAGPCTECDPEVETCPPAPPVPEPNGETHPPPGRCAGIATYYFVAAGPFAMGTDNNRDWNDFSMGVGNAISVASGVIYKTQRVYAFFGSDQGQIFVSTDVCVTATPTLSLEVPARIECIHIDTEEMGDAAQGSDYGLEGGSSNGEGLVVYSQENPGVLTIRQAYEQCLAVGFDTTPAITAVAIMIAESGLQSYATNTIGNTPADSIDRGIAQFNNFYHPNISDECAFNTACAIREMFRVSSGGTDFGAWGVNTISRYREHLSEVQEALGVTGSIGTGGSGSLGTAAGQQASTTRSFKVWAGTSDGRIYVSNNSGRTWNLHVDFADGFPIYGIATPPGGSLWAYGGNTGGSGGASLGSVLGQMASASLVRIDPNKTGEFVSLDIQGDLLLNIHQAGSGFSVQAAAVNDTTLMLGFNGGVHPAVWTNSDPIGSPDGWVRGEGYPNSIITAAPGFDGGFLVA